MDNLLLIDDDDRYSRFRLIAWWDQERLARAKVLVVGAGALGNEVLKNLALLGIGTIYIVDFDDVEPSNLPRSVLFRPRDRGRSKAEAAAAMLADINPETAVRPLNTNIVTGVGLGLFRDVDVVIGCLDNREARLWVNRFCWKVNTPWIDGGIQEINGVVKVFVPPDSACYECAMTENDYRLINLRYSCPLLRQEDMQAGKVPTAPTISSMIAGLQAQEAVKLIHGLPVVAGEAMVFNGVANNFYKTRFQRREDCLSHETFGVPLEVPLSAAEHTARELFAAVGKIEPANSWTLELERDLVVGLQCSQCDERRSVLKPLQLVGMSDAHCQRCAQVMKPELQHSIGEQDPLADQTLANLGIPPYAIARIRSGDEERFLLLGGDRASVHG